jgi:chemotaxis methyl-accepting protein methylase
MQKLHEINVSPAAELTRIPGEIPMHSTMFRADTQMENVLGLALETRRAEVDEPLTVLSVGTSFGAEADSVLGYYAQNAPDIGRISLTGVDINQRAIEVAKQGRYTAESPRIKGAAEPIDLVNYLSMFDVAPVPNSDRTYTIDTTGYRAKHDVSFLAADLVKDKLDIAPADVILCNNLLYHLGPDEAEELVRAMAEHLKVGGVMSFGANAGQVSMNGNHSETSYPQWRRDIGDKLAAEGIEPILFDTVRKAPFVFQKVS